MTKEPRVRLRQRLRRAARSTFLLVRDPQRWSARWYRDKNTMDYVAVQPATWRDKPAPETPEEGGE